ncbi:MAG: putative polyprenyl diphosphate synthase [Conexibacter sp.]|nr:putative polyprenyl diphosphate synthase [Conexibacter sp.]
MSTYEIDVTREGRFVLALEQSLGAFRCTSGLEAACHAALRTSGKLLRPRILLTMAGAGSGDPVSGQAIDAAVAVELMHLASLAHDDVMDTAETRRSQPAVQAAFGTTAALLAGGRLVARGLELVAPLGPELAVAYATTASEMCEGQMLELQTAGDVGRTEDQYFAAIAGKTAALFALAGRAGALVARHDRSLVEEATRFGRELGLAYQLVDDLLDLTATTEQLGKPVCADVHAGVYTLPLILAMAREPALGALLGGDVEPAGVRRIAELVRTSGALEACCDAAQAHLDGARDALMLTPSPMPLVPILDQVEAMLDDVRRA